MSLRQTWMLAALVLCSSAPLHAQKGGWVTILGAASFKDWKVAPERPSARVEETATEKRVVAGDPKRAIFVLVKGEKVDGLYVFRQITFGDPLETPQ